MTIYHKNISSDNLTFQTIFKSPNLHSTFITFFFLLGFSSDINFKIFQEFFFPFFNKKKVDAPACFLFSGNEYFELKSHNSFVNISKAIKLNGIYFLFVDYISCTLQICTDPLSKKRQFFYDFPFFFIFNIHLIISKTYPINHYKWIK